MPIFLTPSQVVAIHDEQIAQNGGAAGIRDEGLLLSALEQPQATMFGEFLHRSLEAQAAAYLYHLARNHPFVDGNKRTAAAATLVFMRINELPYSLSKDQGFDLTLAVAQGRLTKEDIANVILGQAIRGGYMPSRMQSGQEWKAFDHATVGLVDDQSEVPSLRKLPEAIRQAMIQTGVIGLRQGDEGLTASAAFKDGKFIVSNFAFDIAHINLYTQFVEVHHLPREYIAAYANESPESKFLRFATLLRTAMIETGYGAIESTSSQSFVGWEEPDGIIDTFVFRGWDIALLPLSHQQSLAKMYGVNL